MFNLKRTSVRNLKSKYLGELSRKRKLFESTDSDDSVKDITELQPRKRGRPVLLGEELDQKVQTLINELRNKGGNVNLRIVRALGKGVVKAKDRTLLVENGGSIEITLDWALSVLKRMNMVKRRGNTTAKPVIKNFDEVKTKYLTDM